MAFAVRKLNELVLVLDDALRAELALESRGVKKVGCRAGCAIPTVRWGHSGRHQGLFSLDECRHTMRAAHAAWTENPEVAGGELLFCLIW